jgi:hypothetical protein
VGAAGRFGVYAGVTLVAVVACALISWLLVGPFWGLIVAITALTYAYQAVSKRLDPAGPAGGGLTVVTWWVFAVFCMLGGATGGYVQPRALGGQWRMIAIGTALGAVLGMIFAAVAQGVARLAFRLRRPAS